MYRILCSLRLACRLAQIFVERKVREVLKAHGGNNFKLPHSGICLRQLNNLKPMADNAVEALDAMEERAREVTALAAQAKRDKAVQLWILFRYIILYA